MGDRKKGLGFDQLITINPPKDSNHDFYVKFFNSDGSEADMCMNGVRSVGAYLWKGKLAPRKPLLLGTKSKPVLIKPMSSNYNSRPRAAEILVDKDKFHLVRKREDFSDLTVLEEGLDDQI